ncbi:MAG: sensor domain-containing diguanylate cyclase [Deltaproteobacteria bacterium]|nr:sensor domain-containing diguanylate cyclase [Deltaproteobacteria bacterium]
MEEREAFYKGVLDGIEDGVYFVDRERRITYWNRAAERLTGYRAQEVMGTACPLVHVDDAGRFLCHDGCPLAGAMQDRAAREVEVFLRHKDGHRVPVLVRTSPVVDETGTVSGAVEIFTDNSMRLRTAERIAELERLALVDALTGLPNRRYLEAQLTSRLDEFGRYGWPFGVVFMDIDDFKKVNDAHGHAVGDEALRMVARTLEGGGRAFDVVGRWGGEEFLSIVVNVGIGQLAEIGERMRALVASSSGPHGPPPVTISCGVALVEDEDTSESIVGRADAQLYRAKLEGKNLVLWPGVDASREGRR